MNRTTRYFFLFATQHCLWAKITQSCFDLISTGKVDDFSVDTLLKRRTGLTNRQSR